MNVNIQAWFYFCEKFVVHLLFWFLFVYEKLISTEKCFLRNHHTTGGGAAKVVLFAATVASPTTRRPMETTVVTAVTATTRENREGPGVVGSLARPRPSDSKLEACVSQKQLTVPQQSFTAGQLPQYLDNWRAITQDHETLQIVAGCCLKFEITPPRRVPSRAELHTWSSDV